MSYSQYNEQAAILDACLREDHEHLYMGTGGSCTVCGRGIYTPGKFLDIGAYHPKVFSNTRALYEAGWSGLMFEPGPRQMLDLIAEYGNEPRITLVAAAVGIEAIEAPLRVTDDATCTLSSEFADAHAEANYTGTIVVPVLTLERIFLRWGGDFDFINFDAEGVSADLFMALFEKTQARPKCICVEHDGRLTELADTATRAGYRVTLVNGTNAVFAR